MITVGDRHLLRVATGVGASGMPQTFRVDQAAMFAGVVLLSVEPDGDDR
jgi:hypothetical protein